MILQHAKLNLFCLKPKFNIYSILNITILTMGTTSVNLNCVYI